MTYPKPEGEIKLLKTNIALFNFEDYDLKRMLTAGDITRVQEFVKKI